MSARRLLPPAIAVVMVAIVGSVLWLANRSTPIPTTILKTAPAVRSCWNVDAARIGTQLPWLDSPVACTAAHTAEIVSVGQVDQRLVRTAQKAKGQDASVNSFVMATSARAACLDKVGSYVGGPGVVPSSRCIRTSWRRPRTASSCASSLRSPTRAVSGSSPVRRAWPAR